MDVIVKWQLCSKIYIFILKKSKHTFNTKKRSRSKNESSFKYNNSATAISEKQIIWQNDKKYKTTLTKL